MSGKNGAVLSDCGRFRYALWRDTGRLGAGLGAEGTVLFVMLNPSTADATEDDPTIRRCARFAASWGYARLAVGNAYALRSPDPAALRAADDPIGPENDEWLQWLAGDAETVAAWGVNIEPARERQVIDVIGFGGSLPIYCLGQTKDRYPRHPLYLRADTKRQPLQRAVLG